MAMSAGTIPAMVLERAAANGPRPVFREKQRGVWRAVAWADLAARMRAVAGALRAADFRAGDVACILADTRPEWAYADLGILAAGGVSAGIYPTASPELTGEILRDCGARVLFVENEEQLDKALHVRDACPALERIVVFDMKGLRDFADPMCESLATFLARGASDAPVTEAAPDDLAILVYTAGTTGAPKGAMLSHRNILFQVEHAARLLGQHEGDERLSFMPPCHVMERVLGLYLALYTQTVSNYAEGADLVRENLREVRPTVLAAAPHVWERFHARVELAAKAATAAQRALYRQAIGAGLRRAGRRLAGGRPGRPAAASLVLGNVRRELGLDRLRIGLIGAAPSSAELIRWFMALGIELTEIYGQTEGTGLAAAMPAAAPRLGVAGRPVPYGELAIAPDGEVLLRGPHVFMGYWNRPDETARVLRDGWLHTGDLGELDDGYLRITGRRHEVIRTAEGHAVTAPEIEKELKLSPYIADAILFGDGRAFLSCLVMTDHDAVEAWASANDVAFSNFRTLVRADPVHRLIGAEIERTLARLGQHGRIRRYRLIEQKLEPEDPELTPVMRLRRSVVGEKYRALIEEMYEEA